MRVYAFFIFTFCQCSGSFVYCVCFRSVVLTPTRTYGMCDGVFSCVMLLLHVRFLLCSVHFSPSEHRRFYRFNMQYVKSRKQQKKEKVSKSEGVRARSFMEYRETFFLNLIFHWTRDRHWEMDRTECETSVYNVRCMWDGDGDDGGRKVNGQKTVCRWIWGKKHTQVPIRYLRNLCEAVFASLKTPYFVHLATHSSSIDMILHCDKRLFINS